MAKEGLKFLHWAYFSLEESESKETIIDRCIDLAYVDATNQGSFNTRADNTDKNPVARGHVYEYIVEKNIQDYDTWHENLCDKLIDDYSSVRKKKVKAGEDPAAFTYGNAQKWVNMTVKYLFIYRSSLDSFGEGCSVDFCNFYDEKFAPHQSSFHVPIDSFIMQAIWPQNSVEGECDWLPGAKFIRKNHPYLGEYNPFHYTPWSKFIKSEYMSVRDHVRTLVSASGKAPLEWENEEWVRVAKIRKS